MEPGMKSLILGVGLLVAASAAADGKLSGPISHKQSPIERQGYYVFSTIGQAIPAKKYSYPMNTAYAKSSVIIGTGFGYNFNKNISADVSVNHRFKFWYDHSNIENKLSSTSAMITGYYTFPTDTLSPYVALGTGIAFNRLGDMQRTDQFTGDVNHDTSAKGKKHTSFVWHVGAGIRFKASERTFLDLGYRHAHLGVFKSSNVNFRGNPTYKNSVGDSKKVEHISSNLRSHEICLSFIYKL
jgi:opacity protein-like surface antigen